MGTIKLLPLVVLCVFLPTPSKSALKAFDCPQSHTSLWYTPSQMPSIYDLLPKCENIRHSEWIEAALVMRPSATISAHRCRVTYIQSLVDSAGSSRPVSNGTEVLGRDVCLKAHLSKSIELMGELIPHLDVNGTTKHTVPKIRADVIEGNSSVTRTYTYHRSYEITLSTEQGTLQWYQNILRFDRIDCDYDNFTCSDDFYGQLFWKREFDRKAEMGSVLYSGSACLVTMERTMTAPEVTYTVIRLSDKVLAIRGLDNVTNDAKMAFRSEVENVYIEPMSVHDPPRFPWNVDLLSPSLKSSPQWENVYSEKLVPYQILYELVVFRAFDTLSEAGTSAVDVVKRLCEAKKIKLFRYLESLRPSEAVDIPLKGVIATKNSEGDFRIETCSEKLVYRRKSSQCFNEMPVTDAGNASMFLDPYTRKLSSHAVEIDCNPVTRSNVSTTDSPLEGTTVSVKNSMSTSTSGCSDFDWLKMVALALLSIWIIAILVRVTKFLVTYVSQKTSRSKVPQIDTDIELERTFVGNGSSLTLSAISTMLKPPFAK